MSLRNIKKNQKKTPRKQILKRIVPIDTEIKTKENLRQIMSTDSTYSRNIRRTEKGKEHDQR